VARLHQFALDEATIAARPIKIDDVRLPRGTAHEKGPRQKITGGDSYPMDGPFGADDAD
jgi:hypothetical protein